MRPANGCREVDQVGDIGLVARRKVFLGAGTFGNRQGDKDGTPEMLDLLVHEATFARLETELKTRSAAVRPVVLHDDGVFRTASGDVVPEPVAADLVYATPDAFFGPQVAKFMGAVLSAPDLKWFQASAAGTEHPVLQAIGAKAGVYTSSHEQSEAIAEWVLWAGLDWFQNGSERRAAQAEARWQRLPFREISDTHWLVVGFGHIGRETARRLRALGASVTGVRRTPGADPDADRMVAAGEIHKVIGEADAVLLCCPLTPETGNMADAAFFKAMKPGALFVNVGRGALVDEEALLAGLKAGTPGHASLDVVRTEPLPGNSPIWSHPAITLTAHTSAETLSAARRTDARFLANLDRFLAGEPLNNVVPKAAFG